jgi:methyl-accepting chemotaxis protein
MARYRKAGIAADGARPITGGQPDPRFPRRKSPVSTPSPAPAGPSGRRISLRAKLLGSAGILLALIVLVGALGISSLGSVKTEAHDMYEQAVVPLEQMGVAHAKLNENRAFTTNHILETDTGELDELERRIAENDEVVSRNLAAVGRTIQTDEGKASFARLQDNLEAYREARDGVIELSHAGRNEAAYAQYKESIVPAVGKVVDDFETLYDSKVELAEAKNHGVDTTVSAARTQAIAIILIALLVGFGIAFWISRGIQRGVAAILDRLSSLRDHDTTDLRNALQAVADGDLTVQVTPVTPELARSSNDEIGDVAEAVAEIRNNTLGTVDAYNQTRASLAETIGKVSESAAVVAGSSQQVASTSSEAGKAVGEIASAVGEVAQGAERQVRAIESAKGVTTEVASATGESAENARETEDAARQASELAERGASAVAEATDAMESVRSSSVEATAAIRELGEKSEQIGGIVDTITGIAEQTNLLALNAAIEAARAGEQGRGFAVVAEEVRKLAEESQQAAASIAELIGEIQGETQKAVTVVEAGAERTTQGAQTVEQARESFVQIRAAVEDMSGRVGQIAAAIGQIAGSAQRMQEDIGEVAAVAEQSSASAEEVSASTEQTSASTQQIAASAQELASTSQQLEALVAQFKLAGEPS